jgi:hypothetical protein
MAAFAELDSNNKVIRVLIADDNDVVTHGGDQSQSAADYFSTIAPLSLSGVKWIQSSEDGSFRKKYAAINDTYDEAKDKFISPPPFPSYTLDSNDDWKPPVTYPTSDTYTESDDRVTILKVFWDEINLRWLASGPDLSDPPVLYEYIWNADALTWIKSGNLSVA